MAANSGALVGWFCRAARNSSGFSRRAAASSDRLVVSLSVPATNATASSIAGASEHARLGGVADDDLTPRSGVPRRRWDALGSMTVTCEALRPQVRSDLPAEPAVSAHHPLTVPRRAAAFAAAARRVRLRATRAAGTRRARAARAADGRRSGRRG